jgi:hypothetical protein
MYQPFVVGNVDAERLVRCYIAVFPLDVLLLRLHGGEYGIGVVGCVAQRLALRRPNGRNITFDNISGYIVSSVSVKVDGNELPASA